MPVIVGYLQYMNRLYIKNLLIVLTFLLTLTSAVMYRNGPNPSLTNAPSESNCTSCHSGSLITSGNSNLNKIFLETGFPGNGYVPDSTYTIALSYKETNIRRYGFQITSLVSSNNDPAGTFTNLNSRTQKLTNTVNTKSRQYITHTQTGTDTVKYDSTRWVFQWKAPATYVGKIKFYVVLMASNSSSTDGGDVVYGKTFEYDISPLLPKANATSNDSVTCVNYNAQMTGSGTNTPTAYSWKFTNANPLTSTAQNPVVKFTTPGTQLAILTVRNKYGTSAPDTLKVTVKPSPTATITTGTSGTICRGDSILLSANAAGGITYLWTPGGKTIRQIYAKDTGTYFVTTTNSSQCSTKSNGYKLQWYPKPDITITSKTLDTACGQTSETLFANIMNGDSVHWYVNNKLYARTKAPTLNYTGTTNVSIYCIAKSLNNCFSVPSNTISRVVISKINPTAYNVQKTPSNIHLGWTLKNGIDSVHYSLNNINFKRADLDTSIDLSGLAPATFYNIRIRSYQNNFCKFSDTVISVRTNNCSNISYSIDINNRVCRGEDITAKVSGLRKTKTSIAFNNGVFANDTSYTFQPQTGDSLSIRIIDSLSLSCPVIVDKQAYLVDTFPNDNAIYSFNLNSCENRYIYAINPLYQKYEFYLNNVLKYSGANNQYEYTGLATGDILKIAVHNNSCYKQLGSINFTRSAAANALFGYTRNWKVYTFAPADSSNTLYKWYINDTLKSNAQNFIADMSVYSGKTAAIKLVATNFPGCTDSMEQTINFPDFASVKTLNNQTVSVYPNPFGNAVNINTDMNDYTLTVFDNVGKQLLKLNNLSLNQQIDTEAWPKGIYHFVVANSNGRKLTMMIKL